MNEHEDLQEIESGARTADTDPGSLLTLPEQLLEMLHTAVYVCDADGIIRRFNRRAATLWGRQPVVGDPAQRFCGSYRLFLLDGEPLPHDQCPMADVLRTGVPLHDQEVIIERPDGSRCVALVNIDAITDANGRIIGAVNCLTDISERKRLEVEHAQALNRAQELSQQLAGERDRTRALIDALPAAVYTTDAEGRLTYYNEAAVALWGTRPELGNDEFCGSWKLYWPDGSPMAHSQCPMALALKAQRPIRGHRAIAERPDGTRVPFAPYPTPLFENGVMVGAVNMLVDMSEQDAYDAELRAKEERFRALVDTSAQIVWTTDAHGLVTEDSPSWRAFTGQTYEQWKGLGWLQAIHPDDRSRVHQAWQEAVAAKSSVKLEYRLQHVSGGWRWTLASATPVLDARGNVREWVGMNTDTTERHHAEDQRNLLVAEMKHRVKNVFASVQAVASQTLKRITDEERSAFFGRLHALAAANDKLTGENWDKAPLRELIYGVLEPFKQDHEIMLDGPGVWIDGSKSLLLTLVLHELATNAAKYGALSVRGGRVQVTWQLDQSDERKLKLNWRERGGPPAAPPAHKGFGSLLVERVMGSGSDESHFDFAPEGLTCTLTLTL